MNNILDSQHPSGPVTVKTLKITVDRNLCIGAGTCVAIAAKTFILDEEGKAIIIKSANEEEKQTIIDAAKACPVAAIIIEDENGKRIFPQ